MGNNLLPILQRSMFHACQLRQLSAKHLGLLVYRVWQHLEYMILEQSLQSLAQSLEHRV